MNNDDIIKIGIIGTGRIARRFVKECRFVKYIKLVSVYNPHEGSAGRFVDGFCDEMEDDGLGVPTATDNLNAFMQGIDAVYIASPHETHFGYIIQALTMDKHVLCEKPMCLMLDEAKAVFALATAKRLVVMEAIKTAYCPGFARLIEVLESGVIGQPRYVDACFTKLEKPGVRELVDIKYGGSFLELGSYVMLPMFAIFGSKYTALSFESMKNTSGIDIFTKGDFRFDKGLATVTCGLGVKSEGRLLVAGEEGYIIAEAPWWKLSHFEAHFEDPMKIVSYDCAFEGDGLRYEIMEFINHINGSGSVSGMMECSIIMADVMGKFMGLGASRQ